MIHNCKTCKIKQGCELYEGGVRIEQGDVRKIGIYKDRVLLIKLLHDDFERDLKNLDEIFDTHKCPQCGSFMELIGKTLRQCPKCRLKGLIIDAGDNYKEILKEVFKDMEHHGIVPITAFGFSRLKEPNRKTP